MAFDKLWQRIGKLTLGLLAFNMATHVAMPGLNLPLFLRYVLNGNAPLLWLYDKLGGGGLSRISIVALGFMPYLSARIGMLLARRVSPALDRLSESATGQRTLKRWTRGVTVGLSLIQSYGFAHSLLSVPGLVLEPGPVFVLRMMGVLTGGAIVAMMLSESAEELVLDAVDAASSSDDVAPAAEIPAALTAGPAQPLDVSMREAEKTNAPR